MPPTTRKTAAAKRSGNPARRNAPEKPEPVDPQDKYAPTTWLSQGLGVLEDLELPTGQLVLVRRPGVEGLMKAGVIKNLDSLTSIVAKHIQTVEGKNGPQQELNISDLMEDQKLDEIVHVIDKVLCYCVVKPQVVPTPNDVTLKVPGVVYTNMIDLLDKMFVFNYVVGGTRDLESFRGELNELLGDVEAGAGVSDSPE